jgi:V-type H+-transporting ATPase subunit a
MGLYRSEKMKLYQLTLPKDDAHNALNELGDLGTAHFIDLNADASAYGLPYT